MSRSKQAKDARTLEKGAKHRERRARALAALERAEREQSPVRVTRGIRRSDVVEGFVVGVGARWVLLATLDPSIELDGHAALRLRDVKRVAPLDAAAFVTEALRLRNQWPPTSVEVDLSGVGALLRTVGTASTLVTLHFEEVDPEVCHIGVVERVSRRWVHLREVTPRATWGERASKGALEGVTRVEVGGRYEEALVLVGGLPGEGRPGSS